MSDILIRGMEMPHGTADDYLEIKIYPDGGVYCQNTGYNGWRAVPIPPHGRCIDVDALEDNNITYYAIPVLANVTDAAIREAELVIRLKDLDVAPTVLEAEEGE